MHADERLIQRYHDGELSRAEAAGVEASLSSRQDLAELSHRLDALDGLLKERVTSTPVNDANDLVARIHAALPASVPKREVQVSVMHVMVAVILVCFVGMGVMIADRMQWLLADVVPMWMLALLSMACGAALLVAARPLLRLEAGLLHWLLRRRLSVGDGEVLVCRVLGVALLVGGTHIAGLWG